MTPVFMFQSPWILLLLALIPVLALWGLIQQRGYWRGGFAFSQVAFLKNIQQRPQEVLHQRILPLCLLLALAIGIVGLAQPVLKTKVPIQTAYLMLVLDISNSMAATDIKPSRLEAAQHEAIEFINHLPENAHVGLTLFAGNTYLVSPPTLNHTLISQSLQNLKKEDLRPGTAIGDALEMASKSLLTSLGGTGPNLKQVAAGTPTKGTIILLTDGESNLGIPPSDGIQKAIQNHFTIFTVGMGQPEGTYVLGDIYTRLDEPTLESIAQQTGGTYYPARSTQDFKQIYDAIQQKMVVFEEKTISLMKYCLVAVLALVLAALAWSIQTRRF